MQSSQLADTGVIERKFIAPMRQIAYEIEAEYGVTLKQLRSKSRTDLLCRLRFAFYFRALTETKHTMARIGLFLNRDHTSVGYGVMRYCAKFNMIPPRGISWRPRLTVRPA